jgi:nicotinate-nucleotide adenylyltransferase
VRPIGVFGGMFDPIHLGHLRPALETCDALDLRELRFVPCGDPPHRGATHASAALRRRLVEAAIAAEPRFVLDARELERPGPHYTYDTLATLRAELGDRVPLVLLIGADAFAALDRWHRWRELPGLAHLAVLLRPGAALPAAGPVAALLHERRATDAAQLATQPAGTIWTQPVTQLPISSSGLRELLARGASVQYLVPDAVWALLRSAPEYRA